MCRVPLIAERELENEQGTQEVGEDRADSPLSQPEPVGEISTGLQTKTAPAALFVFYSQLEMTCAAAPALASNTPVL